MQPSNDPSTIYHMNDVSEYEEEESYGAYSDYESSDGEGVKKALDEQYNILGVPKEERKYEVEDIGNYVWEVLFPYYLTYDEPPKEDDRHVGGYYMGDEKPTAYPISKEKELAASRVQLGLFIYNSIRKNGSCFMTAEN